MNRDISIPANGAPVIEVLGVYKFLAVRSADVAFQLSFDGSKWINARQNDRWGPMEGQERLFLRAAGGLAAEVSIAYDIAALGAQDTAQSIVLNSALGCGGSGIALTLPAAKRVDNTNYVYNAGARVDLTKNGIVNIPGVVNGKKRKSIYFDNRMSGTDCCIFDEAGNLFNYLKAGNDTPVYETSADFWISGMGGDATNFIYNELFYEKANG